MPNMAKPNVYGFAGKQFISNFTFAQAQAQAQDQARYNEAIDREIYGSDEFRMYGYKIKRCTRMYSHDWTECPYAHHGEKAQRRDPRKYSYNTMICPDFGDDGGSCQRGDNCRFAHGVFEYWLHPARYRTRVCTEGRLCSRKVCFFAHSPDQLRFEPKYKIPKLANKGKMKMMNDNARDEQMMMMAGSSYGAGEASTSTVMQAHYVEPSSPPLQLEGISCLLESLRTMKMREDEARKLNNNNNNSFFDGGSSSNNNNSFFGNNNNSSSSNNNNNNSFFGSNSDNNDENNNNSFFAGNFNSFLGRGVEVADSKLPHTDWISDLLK